MFFKEDFYRLDNILKTDAKIMILYAGRNKGKSYAVKEKFLKDYFLDGRKFVICWRRKGSRKSKRGRESYFQDETLDIKKMSNGEWSKILYRGECYYLGKVVKNKNVFGPLIGYITYLEDAEEGYKSDVFEGVYNFLLEEFITNEGYLIDEPYLFDSIISTIFRNRIISNKCKIFMIGNPVSRVCPYITEWKLDFMKTMKINSIKTTEINGKLVAVERIPPRKDKRFSSALSRKGQQVEEGEWMTEDLPIMLGWQKYDEVYDFIFTWEGFSFHCHCLQDEEGLFLLVHSYTKYNREDRRHPFPKEARVIGDIDSTSFFYTKGFIPICENEKIIFNLIKANKIFFVDSLQGTDFYNCLQNMKRSF